MMSQTLPIYIEPNLLAPAYNYDFTNERDDGKVYWRGKVNGKQYQYHRPYGWYRHAIDVSGKYPGGDSWLSEWPIAYHGTRAENIGGIVKEGFKPGSGGVYEFGVYTSPNLTHVEYTYAKEYKKKAGKSYKIVIQVCVNPDKDHLSVHENVHGCKGIEYWVSTKQDPKRGIYDVRPCAILVKQLSKII